MLHTKHILLTLVFIITIKTSFGISNAFLGDDLGLNLYKNIDSGIIKLEANEYSYELKGQKKSGKIEDGINKILKNKGYGKCKIIKTLSEKDVSKISSGDISLLYSKLSPECKYGGTSIPNSTLNSLQYQIAAYQNNAILTAVNKAKQTFNISRIGLYADGNDKNSPFDIIQDIKEIDKIIFTQKIEYEGETPINDGGFSDYLAGKFKELPKKIENTLNGVPSTTLITDISSEILSGSGIGDIETINIIEETISPNQPIYHNFSSHETKYACINNLETSGLSQEHLDSLGVSLDFTTYNSGGTIDDIEIIYTDEDENGSGIIDDIELLDEKLSLMKTGYSAVNDNSSWKCSTFFCITVDFQTSKHSALGGGKMRSIESIVETSNQHLKKFVNSSLIQGKMTTNNFELPLRDLKLPDIFSFGMVISKKTPPILNLEKKEKKSTDEDPFSAKNISCKRWEATSGNCNRENDLEIFLNTSAEAKSIIDSASLSVTDPGKKFSENKKLQEVQSLMDDFITKAIQRDAGLKETESLYQEFLEIERFISSIQDYSNDMSALIKVMKDIPIHP